jgi:hypothetical protein
MIVLWLVALLATSCASIDEIRTEWTRPTIGPLSDGGDRPGVPAVSLATSTNCAAIGEAVTFTVQIVNNEPVAITMPITPALDIVLRPNMFDPPTPSNTRHWSDTDQYPRNLNLVLQPAEERRYTWTWMAEAQYGSPEVMGIVARAIVPILEPGTTIPVSLGGNVYVGAQYRLYDGGPFPCAKMRR